MNWLFVLLLLLLLLIIVPVVSTFGVCVFFKYLLFDSFTTGYDNIRLKIDLCQLNVLKPMNPLKPEAKILNRLKLHVLTLCYRGLLCVNSPVFICWCVCVNERTNGLVISLICSPLLLPFITMNHIFFTYAKFYF